MREKEQENRQTRIGNTFERAREKEAEQNVDDKTDNGEG